MGAPPGIFAELSRWRAKAEKRGKVTHFDSDIIPDWLNAELMAAQETVGVEAFSFLKATDKERRKRENELALLIALALAAFGDDILDAIVGGEQPNYDPLGPALAAVLIPFLTRLAVEEAMTVSVEMGIVFDPAVLNREALRWARDYGYDLIGGLTETTRGVVSEAMQAYVQNPEIGKDALREMLQPAFGEVRANMIATTETTRAYSEATNEYQRLLRRSGIQTRRIWQTREDERVCEICGPLHNLPESEWAAQFPGGPPAHVNCRCELILESIHE